MAHSVCPREIDAWYAGLRYDADWRLGQVKGVALAEIESFLAGPGQ